MDFSDIKLPDFAISVETNTIVKVAVILFALIVLAQVSNIFLKKWIG
jgi:hypothetical protein